MNQKSLKQSLFKSQWVMLLIVTLLICVLTTVANPKFLMVNNIMNIFEQISVSGLVAVGATCMILSGNFDISVGAVIGLSNCVMATMINNGVNGLTASVVGILIAMLCTFCNGALSVWLKAPSFIITLATTSVYTGISLYITKGVIKTVYGQFDFLGATRIASVIPLIFLISLLGFFTMHVILKYTQLGRRIYAIGTNEKSAYLAGVNIARNKLLFFTLDGFFVGLASVLLLSRVGSALPSSGAGMEMSAIGAVVIGGASINGGEGNIIGTFMGVLLLGLISNVLNILGINPYLQEIASGIIIIVSLGISALRFRVISRT